MKKALVLLLVVVLILPIVACRPEETQITSETTENIYEYKYQRYATMSPEEIVAELTLEQKAAQMVQPLLKNTDVQGMQDYCYGSIYGDEGVHTAEEWTLYLSPSLALGQLFKPFSGVLLH